MLYLQWEKQRKVSLHASLFHAVHHFVRLYPFVYDDLFSTETETKEYREELMREFYLYWLRHASSHQHKWTKKDGDLILGQSFYLEMQPLMWQHLEKNMYMQAM